MIKSRYIDCGFPAFYFCLLAMQKKTPLGIYFFLKKYNSVLELYRAGAYFFWVVFNRIKEVGFICCSDNNTKSFTLKKSKLDVS